MVRKSVRPSLLASLAGAGLVGFDAAQAYAAATVGDAIKRALTAARDLRSFGALANDGATNDYATWAAAAASGERVIRAEGLNCRVQGTVSIPAGQVWLLSGTRITFTGDTQRLFSAVGVNDWALVGPFTVVGDLVVDPGAAVTAAAVYIENCANWTVHRPTIANVRGAGIHMVPGASVRSRGEGGKVIAPTFKGCVWGWKDEPGSGAEYCTVTDVHAYGCAQAGVETAAGNIIWQGGHLVDNIRDGMRVRGGANHAHGIVAGLNLNHNGQYNLHAKDVLNGETFTGCHVYANGTGVGVVYLENCKGVTLDGGTLDAWVYNEKGASGSYNYLRGMHCPGGYGGVEIRSVVSGEEFLVVEGMTGPGAVDANTGQTINDGAEVYVSVRRAAGTTQVLAGPAVLVWPVGVMDRRKAWAGVGNFTVPAGQGGQYRVRTSVLFVGTAMNAAATYVDLRVNGASQRLALGVPYGTTKVGCVVDAEIYLAAGDVVDLYASVTGTGPVFGDATYGSDLTIEKIA